MRTRNPNRLAKLRGLDLLTLLVVLTPKGRSKFRFRLDRLPVDKHNPDHLIWGNSYLERQAEK
ncbi:MAG: hypothetical protein ACREP9_04755 [Candidatus Dormibacteraceae bacterium]